MKADWVIRMEQHSVAVKLLEIEKEKLNTEISSIEEFESKHGSVSRVMQTRFNYLTEMVASLSDVIYHMTKEFKA